MLRSVSWKVNLSMFASGCAPPSKIRLTFCNENLIVDNDTLIALIEDKRAEIRIDTVLFARLHTRSQKFCQVWED